jgi:hypothetical protein
LIRESRFLRALLLTVWLYSLLLWLYIVMRVLGEDVLLFMSFIDFIPWLLFWQLGAMSFLLSAACMLTYLFLWGFPSNVGRKRDGT